MVDKRGFAANIIFYFRVFHKKNIFHYFCSVINPNVTLSMNKHLAFMLVFLAFGLGMIRVSAQEQQAYKVGITSRTSSTPSTTR